ncbi:MAG: hypothetical protein U5K79_14705 [Cyclobacteriaceae bacterium]|nr:hypothetical protein [Cyclobacteriaceae bacterium]
MKTLYLVAIISLIACMAYAQQTQPAPENESKPQNTESPTEPSTESLPADAATEDLQESKSFTLDANDAAVETAVVPDSATAIVETIPQETTTYHSNWSSNDDIQTLAGKNSHRGGFGAISFKSTEFNDQSAILTGFRAGWIINRAMGIGFEGYGIIPTAEYMDIDPDLSVDSRAVGGYGGMFLEPIILSNKVVHVTFPIAGGAGWLGYLVDWDNNYNYENDIIDEDVFWYLEPGAAVELNVARNFRMNLGATYRFTQDMELMSTPSSGFDGWNYFLTLKFGRF